MKDSVDRCLFSFFISTIVFIVTMLEVDAVAEPGEWSPKLYGHFFPILQDGTNSLSMKIDMSKFMIDLVFFNVFFGCIFKWLKPKLSKNIIKITMLSFFLITSFFIVIISINFSFTNIHYTFDHSRIKSMWL